MSYSWLYGIPSGASIPIQVGCNLHPVKNGGEINWYTFNCVFFVEASLRDLLFLFKYYNTAQSCTAYFSIYTHAVFFCSRELQYVGKQVIYELWIVTFSIVLFHCTYAKNIKMWWNSNAIFTPDKVMNVLIYWWPRTWLIFSGLKNRWWPWLEWFWCSIVLMDYCKTYLNVT